PRVNLHQMVPQQAPPRSRWEYRAILSQRTPGKRLTSSAALIWLHTPSYAPCEAPAKADPYTGVKLPRSPAIGIELEAAGAPGRTSLCRGADGAKDLCGHLEIEPSFPDVHAAAAGDNTHNVDTAANRELEVVDARTLVGLSATPETSGYGCSDADADVA